MSKRSQRGRHARRMQAAWQECDVCGLLLDGARTMTVYVGDVAIAGHEWCVSGLARSDTEAGAAVSRRPATCWSPSTAARKRR